MEFQAFRPGRERIEYGAFCSFTQNPSDDQEYSAKWLTDFEVSYRPSGYLLAVGVQNVFDVLPDRNSTVNSFNGIQTYPVTLHSE